MSNSRWYVLHAYSGYEKKVADSIVEHANKLGISKLGKSKISTFRPKI